MRFFRARSYVGLLVLGFGVGLAPPPDPARADNNVTYNFNQPNGKEQGWIPDPNPDLPGTTTPYWDWNLGSSATGGGWQAFSGTNAALSAALFISPCLELSNNPNSDWVSFEITHRYNFPIVPILSGSAANELGQVQYRVASGTGWGEWLGIPSAYFKDEQGQVVSGNYVPSYAPPLFGPLIESGTVLVSGTPTIFPVQAWAGTTPGYEAKDHVKSVFTLPYDAFDLALGDEIQVQFVMATNLATSDTTAVVWEINSIQIKGAAPCAIPEPGTLVLAGIGGLGCLVFAARRRLRGRGAAVARAIAGSTTVTILIAAVVIVLVAAAPAPAQTSWNFQLTNGGWMQTGTTAPVAQLIPPANRWMWTGTTGTTAVTGGPSPHWSVRAVGVQSPVSSAGVFLTSPTFSGFVSGTVPAVNARISIAHNFFYDTGTSGRPIATGQLQYQINGSGTWLGLPLEAFTDGGSVTDPNFIFGPSPFKSGTTFTLVNQADFIAPTYLTPTGSSALPIVSGSAAAFLGSTPSWPGDYYVPTEAYLNGDTGLTAGITSLQLRFTNLNLAGKCENQDGWNVRFVQVDFAELGPPVPEPATLALAATGLVSMVAAGAVRRRRRHQRPSRPSERP